MNNPRHFALIGGAIMVALGVVSFIPGLTGRSDILPPLMVENSYGLFLGLFPMNIFNKLAMIFFGVWGVSASLSETRSLPLSILFARTVFVVMAVLTVLGMIPQTNTLYGYWPLFGNEIWLHAIFALFGAYYGFALTAKLPEDRMGAHPTRESLVR